jgi:acyl-CoA thioesterase
VRFDEDTAVNGEDGHYQAQLSPDWCIWSPNGGYLGTIALRAAACESAFRHPVSLSCQFLAVGAFDAVQLEVVALRRTRVADCLAVTMRQAGKVLLVATIWLFDGVEGYVHQDVSAPDVPAADQLVGLEALIEQPVPYPFWGNIEQRPVRWVPRAERSSGLPREHDWIRFRPQASFDDPMLEAGRCVVVLDTMGWPAASQAHVGDDRFIAPTLSLQVDFHDTRIESEWLLSDAWAPIARGGLIATRNQVWSADRRLLASAASSLICRPRPNAS